MRELTTSSCAPSFLAMLAGAFVGSVTLIPGFIAFPLAGILLDRGVAYMVLSYPIERRFLGARVTIIRNALSFIVSIAVSVVIGLYFGEVP